MKIKFLEAYNGDCIHLAFSDVEGNPRNILIDSGIADTYTTTDQDNKPKKGELQKLINSLVKSKQKIDLLIMTHVDDDHIGGILSWFEHQPKATDLIGEIWFNSGRTIASHFSQKEKKSTDLPLNPVELTNTGITQGVSFEGQIRDKGIWKEDIIKSGDILLRLGLTFEILSPSEQKLKALLRKWKEKAPESLETAANSGYALSLKEHLSKDRYQGDSSAHNGSSIAFILNYGTKRMLFLADSHPGVICKSLIHFQTSLKKPLKMSFVKVSHHGSKANTTKRLLQLIDTNSYIILTNGDSHGHPDKQLLARIAGINPNCNIYFNYPALINAIFSKQDKRDFPDFRPLKMKKNEIHLIP